jgi:hypothetical protein
MSRPRQSAFFALLMLLAAAAIPLTAADKHEFAGGWRTQTIRVDGNDEEWRAILEPVEDEHLSVAFLNDEEALYFCLVTADGKTIRHISLTGLTVWLDPAGAGKKKTFGVRYRLNPSPLLEVLGPGSKDARQVSDGSDGFAGRMEVRPDLLVYELRVPLRKSEAVPLAPDVDAGAAMRVTLETPDWRGPLPPVGGGGRVRVGVGVGGGPYGGIYYPGVDTSLLKPISVAGPLRLATPPSPAKDR